MDRINLNNFGRRSPKEHLCQISLKSGQYFLTRRFLKILQCTYKENAPPPDGHVFQRIGTILVEGAPRNISQNYFQIKQVPLDKKVFRVLAIFPFLIPQQPKFYLELNSLNNFKRGPLTEHSCEVILKSVHWFSRRSYL